MRGIPSVFSTGVHVVGITPAHAGNTARLHYSGLPDWDHPRTCGEYTISQLSSMNVTGHPRTCGEYCGYNSSKNRHMGSPPHMRGILKEIAWDKHNKGITPAHAGNTENFINVTSFFEDHPRTCGEYTKQIPSNQHFKISKTRFFMTWSPNDHPIKILIYLLQLN